MKSFPRLTEYLNAVYDLFEQESRPASYPELKTLVQQDQDERNAYADFVKNTMKGDWEKGAIAWAKMKRRQPDDIFLDGERQRRFQGMTFDFKTFTPQDWENYWLLSQHADNNRAFQKKALANILQHLGREHSHYQYLADRISCGERGTQQFGTQDICQRDQPNPS